MNISTLDAPASSPAATQAATFQAAHDALYAAGGGVLRPRGPWSFDRGLTLDRTVSVQAEHATFTFTGTYPDAIAVGDAASNPNAHKKNVLSGFTMTGPDKIEAGLVFECLNPVDGNLQRGGGSVRDVVVNGFKRGHVVGAGAWSIDCSNVDFKNQSLACISRKNAPNSGESIRFLCCNFFGSEAIVDDFYGVNSDYYLGFCSFDYPWTAFFRLLNGGTVTLVSPHCEAGDDMKGAWGGTGPVMPVELDNGARLILCGGGGFGFGGKGMPGDYLIKVWREGQFVYDDTISFDQAWQKALCSDMSKVRGPVSAIPTPVASPAAPVAAVAPSASIDLGSGSDTLVLKVSQDAYQGNAQYTVSVDGQQIGGTITAVSLHGQGDDTLTLHGNWGSGNHAVAVDFLNDAWGGSPSADRNLYVDAVTYNGVAVPGSLALMSGGAQTLPFSVPTPSA